MHWTYEIAEISDHCRQDEIRGKRINAQISDEIPSEERVFFAVEEDACKAFLIIYVRKKRTERSP
jgi:hypothetical protein